MIVKIRDIGSSKGIIIPATLLKQYEMAEELEIEPFKHGIMLKPCRSLREGWALDSKKLAAKNEKRAMPDIFEDEEWPE